MGGITLRTSLLNLYVRISTHTASDILIVKDFFTLFLWGFPVVINYICSLPLAGLKLNCPLLFAHVDIVVTAFMYYFQVIILPVSVIAIFVM